jgi:hypothetical protein
MVQYDMASIEAEAVSLISMSGKYIALMHILQASMKASMPCCTLCFLCCNLFFALLCMVNPLMNKEVAKLQHLCLTCRCFFPVPLLPDSDPDQVYRAGSYRRRR